jgi:hypothetical protein
MGQFRQNLPSRISEEWNKTKNTNKTRLRIISFWFGGKVIAEPRELVNEGVNSG